MLLEWMVTGDVSPLPFELSFRFKEYREVI
jgi:hypothetical protein